MKHNFILLLLIIFASSLDSQVYDTIYYNINGEITIQEIAKFYRVAVFDTTNGCIIGNFTDFTRFGDTICTGQYQNLRSKEGFEISNYEGGELHLERAKKMCQLISSDHIRKNDYPNIKNYIEPIKEYAERIDAGTGEFFIVVEMQPYFPGGMEALSSIISSLIQYPEEAKKNNITGTVNVRFQINIDGSVSNVRVVKGIGYGCDEEAKRVIELLPDWLPGLQRGIPVKTTMELPISF